jgi:hypothetical protein
MARKRRDNTYGPAGMPDLPNPIDDNKYLASATQAAEMDRLSGAYDEFLFSENGLEQMPYERAIDDHLALVKKRLEDRGRRSVLVEEHKLIDASKEVRQLIQKQEHVLNEIELREADLAVQQSILDGEISGRHGLMWRGKAPEMTSMSSAFIRVMMPYALFVVVGSIDLSIVYTAFQDLLKDSLHAFFFTLPAMAVQLVFPHLIGDRLGLWKQGLKRWWILLVQVLALLVIWIGFALALTAIRYDYLKSGDFNYSALQLQAIYMASLTMLIALGLWLLLVAMNANPHEHMFSRTQFAIARLRRKSFKLGIELSKATAVIPIVEASLNVARSGYDDAISSTHEELVEAAKSVYRRALVNMTGSVEFTNSYLTSPASRREGMLVPTKDGAAQRRATVNARSDRSEVASDKSSETDPSIGGESA